MRCKVGDLVWVTRAEDFPENLGRVGTILRAASDAPPEWEVDWVVMPATAFWGQRPGEEQRELAAPSCFDDSQLFPIRDPGPDAVDEMIQKLGKPEDVKVAA